MTSTAQITPAITTRKERDDYGRSVTIYRNAAGREGAIILLPKMAGPRRYLVNTDTKAGRHDGIVRMGTRKDAHLHLVSALLA